jgi:hypothetical protein
MGGESCLSSRRPLFCSHVATLIPEALHSYGATIVQSEEHNDCAFYFWINFGEFSSTNELNCI